MKESKEKVVDVVCQTWKNKDGSWGASIDRNVYEPGTTQMDIDAGEKPVMAESIISGPHNRMKDAIYRGNQIRKLLGVHADWEMRRSWEKIG